LRKHEARIKTELIYDRYDTEKMTVEELKSLVWREVGPDGELVVNPGEAQVVCWIFEQYLSGKSLGKIAADLEQQGILSPTGRSKWNREAIDKLLSNEKYTGRVLLQKTVSTGAVQIQNDGLMERYLYTGSHERPLLEEYV